MLQHKTPWAAGLTLGAMLFALTLGGCPMQTPPTDGDDGGLTAQETFPTSLHATRDGKATFYSADNGGFEQITGVPYEDLSCDNCHAPTLANGQQVDPATYEPSCLDCHADLENPGPPADESTCLGCHGRQGAERSLGLTDVHRTAGKMCWDCHTTEQFHGDGTEYASQFESPQGLACQDCHENDGEAGPLPQNTAHSIHNATVACSACHVESVITCYSCHFETEIAIDKKRFFSPPRKGFKFLVQREGMVYPATVQTLTYEGESFYVMAPYYAHNIIDKPACEDCHQSAAAKEYADSGQITVTKWNSETGELTGPSGVIPVPPDWQTALKFDFLDYAGDASTPVDQTDPALWQFLKTGADLTQMLYAEPLTAEQVDAMN